MPEQDPIIFDFRNLANATRNLLGYFVHTWFAKYLSLVGENLARYYELGLIQGIDDVTEQGRYTMLFDFMALDEERLSYITGIYFYILSAHKGANSHMMNRFDGKQVLLLRGYDFEGSISTGGGMAAGFSSMHTSSFTSKLADQLKDDCRLIKVMSPKDVYWETVDAQRYFYTDFNGMIPLSKYRYASVYVNASSWKEDVGALLERADHYVVYVSSITEGVMWELEQLDTDARRGRVTVILDEGAIENKEFQLGMREAMRSRYGDDLIWAKEGGDPLQSVEELRSVLAEKFELVTPDEFERDIDRHRQRIAESLAELRPGKRETWFDFKFEPSVEIDKMREIRGFATWVESRIDAWTRDRGIDNLPVFLNLLQLKVFVTLLLGDHFETGRALAAYAAVMQGTYDYYSAEVVPVAPLSDQGREKSLRMLKAHRDAGHQIGWYFLSYGRSHEFDDLRARADAEYEVVYDRTKAAVDGFFREVLTLHGY